MSVKQLCNLQTQELQACSEDSVLNQQSIHGKKYSGSYFNT